MVQAVSCVASKLGSLGGVAILSCGILLAVLFLFPAGNTDQPTLDMPGLGHSLAQRAQKAEGLRAGTWCLAMEPFFLAEFMLNHRVGTFKTSWLKKTKDTAARP